MAKSKKKASAKETEKRKEAEKLLRESERKYRTVVERAQDAMLILDGKYRFKFVNSVMPRLTGYSKKELMGMDFRKLLSKEDKKIVVERYIKRQRGEKVPSVYEFNIKRKNREIRTVKTSVSLIKNPEGKLEVIAYWEDITEKRKAEEALKALNEHLKRQLKRLQAINEISSSMRATLSSSKILNIVLDYFTKKLNYTGARVYIRNNEEKILECRAASGINKKYLPGLKRPLDKVQSVTARAVLEEKVYNIRDIKDDPSKSKVIFKHLDIKAFIIIPLIVKRKCIGALAIDYDPKKTKMSEGEQTLLKILANYVASAIENSELYEKIKDFNVTLKDKVREATSEITEKNFEFAKLTEEAIKEKNKIEAIIDSVAEGVIVIYRNPATVAFNPAAERLLKLDSANIDAKEAIEHLKKIGMMSLLRDANRAKSQTFIKEVELNLPTRKVLKASVAKLKDKSRRNVGTAIVLDDITKFKELDELKSGFVSTVSHELRTPLTSIIGYTELMLAEKLGNISSEQKEALEIVDEESKRLKALINDVLDLSRLESGKIHLDFVNSKLDDVIKEAVQNVSVLANQKKIKINLGLSATPSINLDKAKIKQVLLNLLDNSIKFTNPKGQIEVKTKEIKDHVRVDVIDTGAGIPQHEIPKLFDKFYQSEAHMTKGKGSGLGLSIVRQIIAMHDGLISVSSNVGKGSTFSFALPKFDLKQRKKLPKCWEIEECKKTACPAYGNHEHKCWLVLGTFCKGREAMTENKIEYCKDCRIYKGQI